MHRFNSIVSLPQTSVALTAEDILFGPVYEENRVCVPLTDIAETAVTTLLAVEDRRFLSHRGLDFRAIVRATYANLSARRLIQGGSTITQQLARMAVLRRSDRTIRRKLLEALVAVALERQFTKRQILESYLNAAYFGHNIYGIELAALALCAKRAADLGRADAAYLIGLLKAPARYCRCCNPAAAVRRTKVVLSLAARSGAAVNEPARMSTWRRRARLVDQLPLTGAYPSQYMRRWLSQNLAAHYPRERLIVYSTLDSRCQRIVELACAFARQNGYQGGLACVVQDAQSGAIRAFAGGVDGSRHHFNAASDGRLQPGSLLKPFILMAALQSGITLEHKYQSRPLTITQAYGTPWTVRNAGDRYLGWTTLEDALVFSDNSVYAQLLLDVGMDRMKQVLAAVGLPAVNATLAISTGAIRPGVSPLQICTSYSVFSSRGTFLPSMFIRRVSNEAGQCLWESSSSRSTVCATTTALAIVGALKRVSEEGTGMLPVPCAGLAAKTGTSVSGGWHMSFSDTYRVLTWTESDFLPVGISQFRTKAVSAKALASRVWRLLTQPSVAFSQLFSIFAGVDTMSVKDLLWVEEEFQRT